ncbi:type II toxin-antitoxin system VapC family toxin [Kitasatospora sp. SUK 42]|uniref:type II toxin-antitoxin system VapC family toxin n=1 Tax=Kitasatospora sp. SUK 42 TaxID=1588882 RepID=UPI0018C9BA23|nr:type II toxin-antitoxin system VapC family toxin [Kitasatospora sp. SUK 42]MBV2153897.1 type II toxin-antitoxin system VapC family toxin [Kitasatospora sp. SUK 42]
MIYLDSCAVLKLLIPENESAALRTFLSSHGSEGHATSALTQVEVPRALIRIGAPQKVLDASADLLDRMLRIRLSDPILRAASQLPTRHLRTLDALHLASAEHLEHSLTAFVTYDKRLRESADERDLPVVSPGSVPGTEPGDIQA